MPYTLPPLPYDAAALAPHISAETMTLHHDKHQQAYVDKANAFAADAGLDGKSLVELVESAAPGPLFNNAAQIWNHSFFWQCLSPEPQKIPAELQTRIDAAFGSTDAMHEAFLKEATAHFGSGWAWLVLKDDALEIVSLHDADTPIAHKGMAPLFGLDVWEHAYYVDYRNARPKYVEAVMQNIVNWEFVAQNLDGSGAHRGDQ